MPARPMFAVRVALWLQMFEGNGIGGVNAVRFVLVVLKLLKSVCRNSPLIDQWCVTRNSAPPPTIQELRSARTVADSRAVANVSVNSVLYSALVTATPPVK